MKQADKILCWLLGLLCFIMIGCSHTKHMTGIPNNQSIRSRIKIKKDIPTASIQTEQVVADELVTFAETLVGTKYHYGGTRRETGFDCSGFLWFVFNHFGIKVPRTAAGYSFAGKEVDIEDSKRGDLILFTGSDPKQQVVGHIGIITNNQNNKITFIHAASGGNKGVMFSQMSEYFVTRFVKVNRIFKF
jgi:cell wall-associated NlpC family hydrolase